MYKMLNSPALQPSALNPFSSPGSPVRGMIMEHELEEVT